MPPQHPPLKEHTKYLRRRTQILLQTPTTPTREDGLFAALSRAIQNPKAQEARKNARISEYTWRIIDEIFSARRYPQRD